LNSGRIELLDLPRLTTQLCQLERRTSIAGRDIIDHPKGASYHDDLANAIAGAASLVMNKKSMHVSAETVAAVSRLQPDRYGRANRFSQRGPPPRPLGGVTSNISDFGVRSVPQPAAPSSSFGSVSYSDKFGKG
jgi:hypothetical protein